MSAAAGELLALGVLVTSATARGALARSRAARVERRLAHPGPSAGRPTSAEAGAPRALVDALARAGIERPGAADAWRGWLVAGSVAPLLGLALAGPGAAVVAVVVVVAAPWALLWSWRDRGSARYDAAVPLLLDDAATGLRAGSSLLMALRAAGGRAPAALAADVGALVDSVEQGGALAEELRRWSARQPRPAVHLASAALAVGARTGGRQGRALDAVAETLRDRAAVRREAVALATQARASALVMAVIPLVFAVAAAVLDPRVGHVLVHTPLGIGCLLGGLALDGVAGLWMNRITGTVR